MSLRKRIRFLLPKNPASTLSLPVQWVEKIKSTRVPQYRIPVSELTEEDRQKRLAYWKRMEFQNMLIFAGVFLILLYNLIYGSVLGIFASLGAEAFIASHWYYAMKMQKILLSAHRNAEPEHASQEVQE